MTNQTAAIDQDLSARDNLRLFGRLNGLSSQASRIRADELLTLFDLTQSANQALATFFRWHATPFRLSSQFSGSSEDFYFWMNRLPV